jgi:mRNA interferase RelE/StbE
VSYRLAFRGSAQKEFMGLPRETRAQIAAKLDALELDPRPPGAEALVGRLKGLMRIRAGDYRIVYQIDDDAHEVTVTRVRHRSKVYR